jgi:tetratricopeptide (TPR) repeat protein
VNRIGSPVVVEHVRPFEVAVDVEAEPSRHPGGGRHQARQANGRRDGQQRGHDLVGRRPLARALDAATSAGAAPLAAVLLAELGMIAFAREDWSTAKDLAGRALEIVNDGRFDEYWTSALVYAWVARAAIHDGDAKRAQDCLTRAVRLRPLLTYALPVVSAQALLEMARAYIALVDTGGARAALRQVADIVQQRPKLGVLPVQADQLRAQLDAMRGQVIGASSLTTAELRLLPLLPTISRSGRSGSGCTCHDTR